MVLRKYPYTFSDLCDIITKIAQELQKGVTEPLQKAKYGIIVGMLAGILILLSGCFMRGTEELYCVPKRSNAYLNLQEMVETAIGEGDYCAPVSGENRQAIQQADLDGDGQDEYIVYARTGEEKPLKIFIFQSSGDHFLLRHALEGEGSSFDRVYYAQIDGAGGMELVVGRRVSDQVPQALSVYSFRSDDITELVSTNYTDYAVSDVDANDRSDLFVIRADTQQRNAVAELYRWRDGELVRDNEADLSAPPESYKRTIIGNLSDGTPAFFVASSYDESRIITDVLALRDQVFCNITLSDESGTSTSTVRNYYVYSADIDGDGITEVPNTELLPSVSFDAQTENQYLIIWSSISPDGSRVEKLRTYHNYADGWYLTLPKSWTGNLVVSRRVQGTSMGYVFYHLKPDGKTERFLSIYEISGQTASDDLDIGHGVVLATWNGTSYVAFADSGGEAAALSPEELQTMFHSITTEPAVGEGSPG